MVYVVSTKMFVMVGCPPELSMMNVVSTRNVRDVLDMFGDCAVRHGLDDRDFRGVNDGLDACGGVDIVSSRCYDVSIGLADCDFRALQEDLDDIAVRYLNCPYSAGPGGK
jgi:hypothetical protein